MYWYYLQLKKKKILFCTMIHGHIFIIVLFVTAKGKQEERTLNKCIIYSEIVLRINKLCKCFLWTVFNKAMMNGNCFKLIYRINWHK